MLKQEGIPYKKIYLFAAIIFLITAWFSAGYNHFDEHFQILEFAGLKLGLTTKANLPWEYHSLMRPAFQPMVVCFLYNIIHLPGISDPFIIAFFIRLFSASLAFLAIHLLIRIYAPTIDNKKLLLGFLYLSFFLWFVPYNAARFSSDTTSGVFIILGLAGFLLNKNLNPVDYLVTGLLFGVSFLIRYQVAFMILGFSFWMLIIHKSRPVKFLLFGLGVIVVVGIGLLIDRWFYGEWVITTVNYFRQNLIYGKASAFGTAPWWYYLQQVFINAIPPFSLVYILAVFIYVYYYPKDALTWTIVPFIIAHFLIPHKEIRFLFPIIGLLPILIIRTLDKILQRNGGEFLQKKLVKLVIRLFLITNLVMLIILAFRPADDQISLYQKIWNTYSSPVKLNFTDENPYHRAKVDVNFYKRKNLVFHHVDSLQMIMHSIDTINLLVTAKADPVVNRTFTPVLIYSSFPAWIKHFDFNRWIERTSFWYVYELKPTHQ